MNTLESKRNGDLSRGSGRTNAPLLFGKMNWPWICGFGDWTKSMTSSSKHAMRIAENSLANWGRKRAFGKIPLCLPFASLKVVEKNNCSVQIKTMPCLRRCSWSFDRGGPCVLFLKLCHGNGRSTPCLWLALAQEHSWPAILMGTKRLMPNGKSFISANGSSGTKQRRRNPLARQLFFDFRPVAGNLGLGETLSLHHLWKKFKTRKSFLNS